MYLYVRMYVCMYVYVCICMYMHVCACMCMYVCMYVCMYDVCMSVLMCVSNIQRNIASAYHVQI